MFSDINISQGSVATTLRYGGICNDRFITNFLLSVTVKELWKLVHNCQSYGQEFGVVFFDSRCILFFSNKQVEEQHHKLLKSEAVKTESESE